MRTRDVFYANVTATGCWILAHKQRADGYVRLSVGRKRVYAHRFIYELLNGAIAKHLDLDHLCRNTQCVNPKHLEPVSHAENCKRGVQRCSKLTKCKRGHVFTEASTYKHDGRRHCRICRSIHSANAYARIRAIAS